MYSEDKRHFIIIIIFLSSPEDIFICFFGETEGDRKEGRERNIDVREASIGCLHMLPHQGSKLGLGVAHASARTKDKPATRVCPDQESNP